MITSIRSRRHAWGLLRCSPHIQDFGGFPHFSWHHSRPAPFFLYDFFTVLSPLSRWPRFLLGLCSLAPPPPSHTCSLLSFCAGVSALSPSSPRQAPPSWCLCCCCRNSILFVVFFLFFVNHFRFFLVWVLWANPCFWFWCPQAGTQTDVFAPAASECSIISADWNGAVVPVCNFCFQNQHVSLWWKHKQFLWTRRNLQITRENCRFINYQ